MSLYFFYFFPFRTTVLLKRIVSLKKMNDKICFTIADDQEKGTESYRLIYDYLFDYLRLNASQPISFYLPIYLGTFINSSVVCLLLL